MKKIVSIFAASPIVLLTCLFLIGCSGASRTVQAQDAAAISNAINNGQWRFVATYSIPLIGRSRQVNGYYAVTANAEKLTVGLPYFGRVTAATSTLPSQNVMDFTSSNYKVSREQQGDKWLLSIVPEDYPEVVRMNFAFFSNGSATLDVTLRSRSSISYRGDVSPLQ